MKLFKKDRDDFDYFASFVEVAHVVVSISEMLYEHVQNHQLDAVKQNAKAMHQLESDADANKIETRQFLYQDFLPPIERDDIMNMVYALDTLINNIEDIYIHIDMYRLETIEESMIRLIKMIKDASYEVLAMIKHLEDFHHPSPLFESIKTLLTIEDEADSLYILAIRALYEKQPEHPMNHRIAIVYRAIEAAFDAMEDLTIVVEAIVLKNS